MSASQAVPAVMGAEGMLIVNKLQGLTSHDVVQRLRRKLGVRRIGHGGTLDPMAEGVLVLLVGRATKQLSMIHAYRKCYEAVITLGAQTQTADAWGEVIRSAPVPVLSRAEVDAGLAALKGTHAQVPPAFSAVKVRGRPLYWWARHGQPQTVAPRAITVFSVELLHWATPHLTCRVECSTGTYVRALAERVAEGLGTVGHLSALTRISVGPWHLHDACDLAWVEQSSREDVLRALQPLTGDDAHSHRT